ncbi:MAG: hypothetical protein HN576_00940 [Bacteriovoracaceae bacterium]|nr:hypothetical protein [Bacteriovoracaceae bacterium]
MKFKNITSNIILISCLSIGIYSMPYGNSQSDLPKVNEECVDKNLESPGQNVSKSAIGTLFDTFSDTHFCKDQFLTKNDLIGFCECEKDEPIDSIDIEQVETGIIEKEVLTNALEINNKTNEDYELDLYLLKLVDLKLEFPKSCKKIFSGQEQQIEKCQKNIKRWKILQKISKSKDPLSLLDKDNEKKQARKTLQDIMRESKTSSITYLLGQTIKENFDLTKKLYNPEIGSLGTFISNEIENKVDESLISSGHSISSENLLSRFIGNILKEAYSIYIQQNNLDENSIVEQRQLTAEILSLFKNKEFKLSYASEVDKYVVEKNLDPNNITAEHFQNIIMKTIGEIIKNNAEESKNAEVKCYKMIQTTRIACEENEFSNISITPELYKKHLASFFPARMAGKVACLEMKNKKITNNKAVSAYFGVTYLGDKDQNSSVTTSSTNSVLDLIVYNLDGKHLSENFDKSDTAKSRYFNAKNKSRNSRVVVNSVSSSQRRYATALASGDKKKIEQESKNIQNEIRNEKTLHSKISKSKRIERSFDDDITKVKNDDSMSEITKIEEMIKKNEQLYALNDTEETSSKNEFASMFNQLNKNKSKEYSPYDFISPATIDPEPINEDDLDQDEKEQVYGAKSKLDGLIERYEDLLEKKEQEKLKKEKNNSDEDAVDLKIKKMQRAIEDLKRQRTKLMDTIENQNTKKVIAKPIEAPSPLQRSVATSAVNTKARITSTKQRTRKRSDNYGATESASGGGRFYKTTSNSSPVINTKDSVYSGVSTNTAPTIKLRSNDMVISSEDFINYSSSDFDAYFSRFGSGPMVVKQKIEVTDNGVKKYKDVLEYYFPEIDSGKIIYVKRNPKDVRQAISNVMAHNNLDHQIDLAQRSVAKHSELIQLFEQ